MAEFNKEQYYNVKNRSAGVVVYRIPELGNLRREFAPGEIKKIQYLELEKLTYRSGGRELIENFLQILEPVVTENLNIRREPEYNLSEEQIKELMLSGSLDAFLDALDFAPIGVIDLIKAYAVKLPLADYDKRRALKEKTGFDVDKAIANLEREREEERENGQVAASAPQRRVKPATETATPGRRTTPDYKVVSKKSE